MAAGGASAARRDEWVVLVVVVVVVAAVSAEVDDAPAWHPHHGVAGLMNLTLPSGCDLAALDAAAVVTTPFQHVLIERFLPADKLKAVNADFPPALLTTEFAERKNVDEKAVRKTGQVKGAYKQLLDDMKSDALKHALSRKFHVNLRGTKTRITLRGSCQPKPCGGPGSVHKDSVAKVISVLLYLNEEWPAGETGGHLLLLRTKNINDVARTVPSYAGNLVAFKNSKTAWHALNRYVGERRAIQLNYERPGARRRSR